MSVKPVVDPSDVLGLLANENTALHDYLARRLAENKPVVQPRPTPTRIVPYTFSVTGKRGEVKRTNFTPRALHKGVDLFATDTYDQPGRGSYVTEILVGSYMMLPFGARVPTWMFMSYVDGAERAVAEDAAKLMGTPDETDAVREMASRLRVADMVRRLTWPTGHYGVPITFGVSFTRDCTWEAVLWVKEQG